MATQKQTKQNCIQASSVINQTFPHIRIIYVPYTKGLEENALNDASHAFFNQSIIDPVFDSFKTLTLPLKHHEKITLGPFREQTSTVKIPFSITKYAACVFVPEDEISLAKSPEMLLISYAYPAIVAILDQNLDPQQKIQACQYQSKSKEEKAQINMLCDFFSALTYSVIKKQNFVEPIVKARSINILSAYSSKSPEFFPTAVACDLASLILQDAPDNLDIDGAFHFAIASCEEIKNNLPIRFIYKWFDFAKRAQILAWTKTSFSDIAGMALHTCEDIDIRAIASIIASSLNLSPPLATYLDCYNPFAEDEVNERHHKDACRNLINQITRHLKHNRSFDFKATFQEQNIEILHTSPVGWCAPSISATTKAIADIQKENGQAQVNKTDKLHSISNIFLDMVDRISWSELSQFFEILHNHKREGNSLSGDTIVQLIDSHADDLKHASNIRAIFAPYRDKLIYDARIERQSIEDKDSSDDAEKLCLV